MKRLLATILLSASPALAVDVLLNHSGRLVDAEDHAVNGTVYLQFAFYDAARPSPGERDLWRETYRVEVKNGTYSVLIGSPADDKTPLPSSVFAGGAVHYLQVSVAGQDLLPRYLVGSVPLAASATGLDCAGCVSTANLGARSVTDDKVADVAAGKITGQLTDSQIGEVAAYKISGELQDPQIAHVAASKLTGFVQDAQIGAVATSKLTGLVQDAQVAGLDGAKLTAESVGTAQLAKGSVGAAQLANGAVGSAQLAASAVGSTQLAAGAVGQAHVKPESLQGDRLAAGSVALDRLSQSVALASHTHTGQELSAIPYSKLTGTSFPMPSANAPPSAPTPGTMYWDTEVKALYTWNGVAWQAVSRTPGCGEAPETAKASCDEIKTACGAGTSGAYWINPGGTGAFRAWCEMDLAEGGWTLAGLVSSWDGIASDSCDLNWDYEDARWTDASTLNADAFDDTRDRKLASWARSAFTRLLIVENVGGAQGWKTWDASGNSTVPKTSLAAMFAGPCNLFATTPQDKGGTITPNNAVIFANNLKYNCTSDTIQNDDTSRLFGDTPANPAFSATAPAAAGTVPAGTSNGGWGLGVNGNTTATPAGACDFNSEARPQLGGWSCEKYTYVGRYTGGSVWPSLLYASTSATTGTPCRVVEPGHVAVRIYVK